MLFQRWPLIFETVNGYCKGESVKKADTLTKEEILKYLKTVFDKHSTNRYLLVRAITLSLGYCGGNRMAELRNLTQESVKPDPEGFRVTFYPAKQRQQIKSSQ